MPTLYVIAGCNGSGKSTFMQSTRRLQNVQTFDPDALFAAVGDWDLVVAQLHALLQSRRDVAVETTLAGRTMLQHMKRAKADGYSVDLIFIGTSTPALNIGRVRTRTSQGGHAIPPSVIEARWKTSLRHLAQGLEIADRTLILDNSGRGTATGGRFRAVASVHGHTESVRSNAPRWLREALPQIFDRKNQQGRGH